MYTSPRETLKAVELQSEFGLEHKNFRYFQIRDYYENNLRIIYKIYIAPFKNKAAKCFTRNPKTVTQYK